jgi:hypothetical protein
MVQLAINGASTVMRESSYMWVQSPSLCRHYLAVLQLKAMMPLQVTEVAV